MLSFSAWLKGGPSLVCLGNRLRVILYFTSQAGTWLLLPGVDWGQERLGQGTVDSENWWKKHKVEQPKASQGQLVSSIRLLPFVASFILCLQACLDGFSATKSLDVFAFLRKMGSSPKLNCNDFRRCYMVWNLRLRPQMLGIIWGDVVSLF